jgi:hypothetical protein
VNNYNIKYIAKILANILNITLFFLQSHLYMAFEGKKLKKRSNNYFSSIIFLFRLAGVQFKINKISTIYAFYVLTVVFCTCSTIIGLVVGVYEHRDDLGHIMTSMRVLIPLINDMVIYVYCR